MPRRLLATGDRLRREWWLWGWEEAARSLPPQRWPDGVAEGLTAAYADGYRASLEQQAASPLEGAWKTRI